MHILNEYLPEILTFCIVFVVLSGIQLLYTHSTIIRWIVRFMLLRALLPLIAGAGIYLSMR